MTRTLIILLLFIQNLSADSKILKFKNSSIPFIETFSDEKVKHHFNTELSKRLARLRCHPRFADKPFSFWENYTSIQYSKNDILSIKIRSNYNCDGVHPSLDIDHSFSYDLENNRLVTLDDIFQKKSSTLSLIREKLYSRITQEACQDEITYYLESEKLFKEYLNFYFSEKGIVFILKLPHGIRHCMNPVEIAYGDIHNKTAYTGPLKKILRKYEAKSSRQ
ncbi:MAG: hypothetical protein CME62_05455 [Halobacteriovoraceae bacterium]|nr:hypothetical protein [Halobacteriovoraceae bacterium]|tara:strand:+ start:3744 stop:4406 length:663 start_codon:yes stop_codon:yes gene_type:complete